MSGDDHLTLRIGDSFSATHPIGRSGTAIFMETLEAKGPDAGMEIEYYASGQLGKQRDMPAVLRTGIAQIAAVSPAYVGTQLPLSNVGDLPGFTQDPCIGGDAMLEIMQPGSTLFEAELAPQDVRPLWVAYIPGYEAMSGSFPVDSMESLHGKIMRSTGGAADRVVDRAGAAGVSMPLGDMYEAISRGTVEGTLASPISITPYSLEEVISYSTDGARLGSFTVTYSVSNTVWNQMTLEQQDVLTEASELAQVAVCEELVVSVDESKQDMRDAGVEMVEVTDAQRPEWDALSIPVREAWINDLESIGLPAAQVLEDFHAALDRAEAKHGGERS
ncbi:MULTISPECIES: TRAP transporter substrate-binding protein [unclassified Dietzia]|uniref:TRAP transporter substrate-binding protein n=1 Tax=unclassified Dietzia TaxID=2617939 RepID=UPI0015FE72F7|nr:TRAP transporter substrate-binding protein DctP [Dietzia sp. DQ12-76]MBB1024001.1 ABC transporter substrate-binding protein [Dietzia sp. DQ12-76]MBB1027740.1 ABC transporter substrate-binding protein [Dietzia sp. DQ11-38-2]